MYSKFTCPHQILLYIYTEFLISRRNLTSYQQSLTKHNTLSGVVVPENKSALVHLPRILVALYAFIAGPADCEMPQYLSPLATLEQECALSNLKMMTGNLYCLAHCLFFFGQKFFEVFAFKAKIREVLILVVYYFQLYINSLRRKVIHLLISLTLFCLDLFGCVTIIRTFF